MPESRRPWKMRWIVIAIILFIVPYTYLTIHFRKPGQGFEPYHDAKERISISKVGYHRVTLQAARPSDTKVGPAVAPVLPATGGLPPELKDSLLQAPLIPDSIGAVSTPAVVASGDRFEILFSCTLSDSQQQLSGGDLYIRGREIVVVPVFERVDSGLVSRTRQNTIILSVPPDSLDPGSYTLKLVGQTGSKSWGLQVH